MRISDWSSDVCSSDLSCGKPALDALTPRINSDSRAGMTQRLKFRKPMHRAAGPAIAVIVVLAMSGEIIFGPTGLYAWGDSGQSVETMSGLLSELTKKQTTLQKRVSLLERGRVDISEEHRVGEECDGTCRCRWTQT